MNDSLLNKDIKEYYVRYRDKGRNDGGGCMMIKVLDDGDDFWVEEWDVKDDYELLRPCEEERKEGIKYHRERIVELKKGLTGNRDVDKAIKEGIEEHRGWLSWLEKRCNRYYRYKRGDFEKIYEKIL